MKYLSDKLLSLTAHKSSIKRNKPYEGLISFSLRLICFQSNKEKDLP